MKLNAVELHLDYYYKGVQLSVNVTYIMARCAQCTSEKQQTLNSAYKQ